MKRYNVDGRIPTLDVALSEFMNSDDLKKLAGLTKEKLPTRKADLAAVIMRHLDGEKLRAVWQNLDELQRAAVAEVVQESAPEVETKVDRALDRCLATRTRTIARAKTTKPATSPVAVRRVVRAS